MVRSSAPTPPRPPRPEAGDIRRLLPFAVTGIALLVGLVLDTAVVGAPWWASSDRADIALALAFPVGGWLVLVAAMTGAPLLLRHRPSPRGAWLQAMLIAATSGVAWLPSALILEDVFGPTSGPRIALPLAVGCGVATLVVACWPRRSLPRTHATIETHG